MGKKVSERARIWHGSVLFGSVQTLKCSIMHRYHEVKEEVIL